MKKLLALLSILYAIQISRATNFNSFAYDNFKQNSRASLSFKGDLGDYLLMSCPKKVPIDEDIVIKAERCLENELEDESVAKLLMMAAANDFHNFGTRICKAWPNMRICLKDVITYLENCHEKSYIGQVTDEIVNFACSAPTQGKAGTNNLGDFLTAEGFSCISFSTFSSCMKHSLDQSISFCTMVDKIRECAKPGFERCVSPKPWAIASNLFEDLETKMNCGDQGEPVNNNAPVPQLQLSDDATKTEDTPKQTII